jgi:hypothetical protein
VKTTPQRVGAESHTSTPRVVTSAAQSSTGPGASRDEAVSCGDERSCGEEISSRDAPSGRSSPGRPRSPRATSTTARPTSSALASTGFTVGAPSHPRRAMGRVQCARLRACGIGARSHAFPHLSSSAPQALHRPLRRVASGRHSPPVGSFRSSPSTQRQCSAHSRSPRRRTTVVTPPARTAGASPVAVPMSRITWPPRTLNNITHTNGRRRTHVDQKQRGLPSSELLKRGRIGHAITTSGNN